MARTILLFHIISDGPSKQPLMVRTFLKVYMELGSYFLFLQEQIKDIIIIISHRHLKDASSRVGGHGHCLELTAEPPREIVHHINRCLDKVPGSQSESMQRRAGAANALRDNRQALDRHAKKACENEHKGPSKLAGKRVERTPESGAHPRRSSVAIVFVGGTCGSIKVESFNRNMKALGVLEGKWDPIRKKLVRRLLEEQDKVLRSYYAQKGGTRSKGGDRGNCKARKHVPKP